MNPRTLPRRIRAYVASVLSELRKTTWPSRGELVSSALVTLAFTVCAVIAFVLVDSGIGSLFGVIFT